MSVGLLFFFYNLCLTCWISNADTLSPCHQNQRGVFYSNMSLRDMLTDDNNSSYWTLLYLRSKWQVVSFSFFFFALVLYKWFWKISGLTPLIHHRGKCDSERPDHLLHWLYSDTTGRDRHQLVLMAKIEIENDRWTEICWAACYPATTQTRVQGIKQSSQSTQIHAHFDRCWKVNIFNQVLYLSAILRCLYWSIFIFFILVLHYIARQILIY